MTGGNEPSGSGTCRRVVPFGASHREQLLTTGSRASRFDSGGRVIVSGGDDGTVRIRDAPTGEPRGALGRAGGLELYDAAVSPAGDLVLAGGRDGTARLWRWRATQARRSASHARRARQRRRVLARRQTARGRRGPCRAHLARRVVRSPGDHPQRSKRHGAQRGDERRVRARRQAHRGRQRQRHLVVVGRPDAKTRCACQGPPRLPRRRCIQSRRRVSRDGRLGRRGKGVDGSGRQPRRVEADRTQAGSCCVCTARTARRRLRRRGPHDVVRVRGVPAARPARLSGGVSA